MEAKKIMIIDDDKDDRGLVIEAINKVGQQFLEAADGEGALLTLRNSIDRLPDLILLDINMPIMNGWQFLLELKKREEFKDIPVIIHTTSTRKSDSVLAHDLGAICFVTKQAHFKKIIEMLEIITSRLAKKEHNLICNDLYRSLGINLS